MMISKLAFALLGLASIATAKPTQQLFDGSDPSNIHAVLVSGVSCEDGRFNLSYAPEVSVDIF
jgi:hypothetical protein